MNSAAVWIRSPTPMQNEVGERHEALLSGNPEQDTPALGIVQMELAFDNLRTVLQVEGKQLQTTCRSSCRIRNAGLLPNHHLITKQSVSHHLSIL